MSIVLDIKNLNFSYDDKKTLYDNFSLSVKNGEIVAVLGESGSGKSTLFDLICGNLKQKSGEISCKKTAQIYQDPYSSFHPSYSIISQIKDVLGNKLDDNECEKFCEKLSINKNLLSQKPHKLSGGELQRCSALRAMLLKPELLLADEPTSALDNITQLELLKCLIGMLENCGVLLITHDLSLAKWCADKIVYLENS